MERRLTLLIGATLMLVTVGVSACGGAAPAPTTAPAVALTMAPTMAPAAPTAAPAPTAAQAAAAPVATSVPSAAPTKAPAAATAAPPAATGDVTAGKAVFDQNCDACHPGGDKGAGPALKGKNLSAARITSQVRNGAGSMPAYSTSQISDQQLNNLVAYVQSLK